MPDATSMEYTSKLQQQLIQKDNLIRLLQMKLDAVKKTGGAEPAAPSPEVEEHLKRANARLAELAEENRALAAELADLRARPAGGAGAGVDEERVASLEAECENLHDQMAHLRKDLERARRDADERAAEIARLREGAGRAPAGKPGAAGPVSLIQSGDLDLARLERKLDEWHARGDNVEEVRALLGKIRSELVLELDRRDAELERLRAELRKAEPLRAQAESAEERARRAEDRLAAARIEASLDGAADGERIPLVYNLVQMLDELAAIDTTGDTADAGRAARVTLARLETLVQKLARDLRIERVPTIGEPYDPAAHEVVEFVRSRDHEDDVVVDEVRRGFRQGGRIIRPAQVRVVKNRQKCGSCGNVVRAGSIFCDSCGTRLEAVGAPVADLRQTAEMYFNTATIFEEKSLPEKAREYYQQAVALEPGNPRYLMSLGRALERSGDYTGAIDCLRQIPEREALRETAEERIRQILVKKGIVDGLRQLT